MAINDKALLQPTRGTIFVAPAETALPDAGVKAFTLNADDLGDWKNLGHTSNDNKVSFSTDGGDAETHDTWLLAGARTTYSSTTLTVTGASVQVDSETMKFVYNGWTAPDGGTVVSLEKVEQKLALFVLCYDPGADTYFGIYLPNTSFTYSALPDITGDNFAEIGFTASVLTSATLPVNPRSGKKGTFAFYGPESFIQSIPVTGVAVTPAEVTVAEGEDAEVTVAFTPTDATDQSYTVSSSDDQVVTASIKDGLTVLVHGVKGAADPVTVTVTSTDGGKVAEVQVTVQAAPALGTLTVTAGKLTDGKSLLTLPTPDADNFLRYKVTAANALPEVEYDTVVDKASGWEDIPTDKKVAGTAGQVVTVVEATEQGAKARAKGVTDPLS